MRSILQAEAGREDVYACWIDDYDPSHPSATHVVKAHYPEQLRTLAPDVVLSCYRDLRAVAGSLIRMDWARDEPTSLGSALDDYVAHLAAWRGRADLTARYDDILERPHDAIRALAHAMRIEVTDDAIAAISRGVDDMRPDPSPRADHPGGYDPTTLLHQRHRGMATDQAAAALLSPRTAAWIDTRYHAWLAENGFPATASVH